MFSVEVVGGSPHRNTLPMLAGSTADTITHSLGFRREPQPAVDRTCNVAGDVNQHADVAWGSWTMTGELSTATTVAHTGAVATVN